MKKWFMNLPLRYKITIFNFSIIFFVILFVVIFFYQFYEQNVVSEVGNYQLQNTKFIGNDIKLIEDSVEEIATSIVINESFQYMLGLPEKQIAAMSHRTDNLNTSISIALDTLVANDYVNSIAVYTKNGYAFYYSKDDTQIPGSYTQMNRLPEAETAKKQEGKPYWTSMTFTGKSGSSLVMVKDIMSVNNLSDAGVMMVCIDWSRVWVYVPKSNHYIYMITDAAGHVVSSAGNYAAIHDRSDNVNSLIPQYSAVPNKSVITIGKNRYLYIKTAIAGGRMYIISLLPMREALVGARDVIPVFALAFMICLAFSLALSAYTSSFVTKPVKKLIDTIHQIRRGYLDKKVHFDYQDEIGELGTEYNKMLDQLDTLFNKVMKLEIVNKETEIKALQNQMNPHFLYNTLDSIYIKAMNSDDKDTAEMIYSLSQIFRLTLNFGNEFFTVERERDLIESYLALQKMRFKNRITYSISIEEQMLNIHIPKMILQPFVENTVVHGMGNSTAPITIQIRGRMEDNKLIFVVSDNGCGIDPETLKELLSDLKSGSADFTNDQNRGFAIRNVRERLALYYDREFSFNISSEPGRGTNVILRLNAAALKDDYRRSPQLKDKNI